jgi:1,5-anhydro-D-fructose reductase (1,5-anhydro-D-mannitol-forming)
MINHPESAMHAPVRFGIAGYGNFAERAIAPAIKGSQDATLVAVQNRSAERARANAAAAGAPHGFSTVEAMVRHPEVDAIFIVSANAAHCRETIAAAEAGRHVIVEKPMAMTGAEAEAMIEACRRSGVRLMVGHMIRLSPLARRIREIVRSGVIGAVRSARAEFIYDARLSKRSWLCDRALAGGGPVYDIAVHCIDTLRFVLDDEVVHTAAALDPPPTRDRTEETAHLALRFSRGAVASVTTSFRAPLRRRFLEVVGDDGIVSAADFSGGDFSARLELALGREESGFDHRSEMIPVPNLYVAEITHFCDAVLRGTPIELSGENGLANQRILDAAMQGG